MNCFFFFYPNIKKKTLFSILCSAVETQIPCNWWLCSVIWHMKGFQLPASIASHFGKILPVLPVNLNMSFLWKKALQCYTPYDWLLFPLNNVFKFLLPYIIFSADCSEMQLYLTWNYFSQHKKLCLLHHALGIIFFPLVICLTCRTVFLFKGWFTTS